MKFIDELKKKPWANAAIAACIAILFYVVITHLYIFAKGLSIVYGWIRPLVIGLVLAYVLNPLANFFEKSLFGKVKKQNRRRALATALTLVLGVLFVALLLVLLIPQLVDSIRTFASNIGAYSVSFQNWIKSLNFVFGGKTIEFSEQVTHLYGMLETLPSLITSNMGGIVEVTSDIGASVFDVVLALFVTVYLMADKHRLMAAVRRLLKHWLNDSRYDKFTTYWNHCNEIFVRFIAFDLLDGIIVGVVNCIFMLIVGIPYSVLISVVVAVTNLAPTFGPIAGGAIGAFILLLVNPLDALWFLIFTVILQTLDGYVIKPRLFGESLGVPAVWILITLIVGGRMFGMIGILLAIPIAAIILFACKELFPYLFLDDEETENTKAAASDEIPQKK
ncbi:MAG: AI-2E family transporter [Lachnospiraceae bacterium]|nr:AI-2E family transporter [Lachnospiraceae bacterium]